MSRGHRRRSSVRAAVLVMGIGAGLYTATLGAYVLLELEPAATALRVRASTMAAEYDSLGSRIRTLEGVFGSLRAPSRGMTLAAPDPRTVDSLRQVVRALAAQSAGVQASLILTDIPAEMRIALGEAAGIESRVAGLLLEALRDLAEGTARSAAAWLGRAEAANVLLVARLAEAQRLGLVDLADRERILAERAHRVELAVPAWLVFGVGLVVTALLILRRRLYDPLATLEGGLSRVAEGDLETSLPVRRDDELGRLTEHFNQMTAVLRTHPEVEALRRSEVRFRSLTEHSLDLITIVGADGRFKYVSPAVTPILGYDAASLIGRDAFEYLHPDDRPGVAETFKELLGRASRGIPREFRLRHKDGTWRHFESQVTNLLGEPMVAGLVINSRDITSRRDAEETLRRERYLVDMLLEHIPDSIYFKDPGGQFLRVNRALARRLGLRDPAAAVGQTDFDFFAREHAEAAQQVETEILRTGQPAVGLEEREVWPDGRSAWVSTTKMPLRDAAGTVVGTFGISRDITERLEAERRLRESEERFRSLTENSLAGIYIVQDGRLSYVNPALERIFGYAPGELVGREPLVVIHPDDRALVAEQMRRRIAGEVESLHYAFRGLRKDGTIPFIEVLGRRLTLDGRPAIVGTILDVTEQREAERLSRESEARVRAAFMTATDAYVIVRQNDGTILEANDQFLAMYGYGRDEVIGRTSLELGVWAEPEQRSRVLAAFAAAGSVRNMEVLARRRNGETFPVLYSVTPLPSAGPPLYMGVIRDVTEARRSAAALHTLEEQFRQAQRLEAVGRLAGGVAHDFNNVLMAINGYAELLRLDFPANDPRRAELEEILAATRRATDLTRQLLAFSRKQVLQPRTLDLNEVVRGLEKMVRRLIGEDVKLTFTPGAPLGTVRADPGQIEQVLLNLAVNARDAMPGGGHLTIETGNVELDASYVRTHPGAAAGPYVMLAVSDTGTGMDAETQSHIFEPFFTTKEQGKGTGLGLATVHGIVSQSGGSIFVYSEPGHGSTFKVYLPRVDQAAESLDVTPAPPSIEGGGETVLLVEDDKAVRESVGQTLERRGYRVLRAPDSAVALELAAAGRPALLLTDVVVPGMTGRELARTLTARYPSLKVLFMSGYTDDAILQHAVLEEGAPFIQKPFTSDALLFKVRSALSASPHPLP